MRALTLTQPWAGLVASGIKLIENRPRRMIKPEDWATPFAIHASREIDQDVYERIAEIAPDVLKIERKRDATIHTVPCFRDWYRLSRDTSAVIAIATVVTYVTDARQIVEYTSPEQERWFFGPIGYVLSNVVALREPVPCKGALGFWRLPEDVEHKVRAQLEAPPLCGKYLGDNDATCPQLTCIRRRGHDGPCDNVNGGEDIKSLIDRSSIGAGLRDIKERGIEAHLADLEKEMG